MKPILGLFLLTALATRVFSADLGSNDDAILQTKGQIVATIPASDDRPFPLELAYGYPLPKNVYNPDLFVTLHVSSATDSSAPEKLRFWKRYGAKYKLLKELEAGHDTDNFGQVDSFLAKDEHGMSRYFIFVPCEVRGTGHGNEDEIYFTDSDNEMRKTDFEHAPSWFKSHLKAREGIWKGERNRPFENGLRFAFEIWKEGDGNCCPTAGAVTGFYGLTSERKQQSDGKYEESFRVAVTTYTRGPIKKE